MQPDEPAARTHSTDPLDERLDVHTRVRNNSGLEYLWRLRQAKNRVRRTSRQLGEALDGLTFYGRVSPRNSLRPVTPVGSQGWESRAAPSLEDIACLEDEDCLEDSARRELSSHLEQERTEIVRKHPSARAPAESSAAEHRLSGGAERETGGAASTSSSGAATPAVAPASAPPAMANSAEREATRPSSALSDAEGEVSPPRVVSMDMLTGLQYLGSGEFCSVWGATLEGTPVAVKLLKEEHRNNELAIKDLESETHIMAGLRHPGCLKVRGVGENEGKPFLVLDRLHAVLSAALPKPADQAPLWERRSAVKKWPLARALNCGLELAEALRHCHDEAVPGFRLLHRDLKPDNIGFLSDGKLVLFDFGLAKLWKVDADEPPHAARPLTGQTGSARYMAPEVAASRPYGMMAEVYSFGVILWQLASHDRPYAGYDMQSFQRCVVEGGQRPAPKKSWPQPLCALLADCWHADPTCRPAMAEVCARLKELLASADAKSPRGGSSSTPTSFLRRDSSSAAGPAGSRPQSATQSPQRSRRDGNAGSDSDRDA